MYDRKHKLPATFLIVCIIALIGFKDTGIFVKEYVGLKDEGEQLKFEEEENVNIIRETNDVYIVEKEGNNYEVPKEFMIRATRSGQEFKVAKNTSITDKPNGNTIRLLNIGEIVQALSYESGYGLFQAEDGVKGYVDLENLEKIIKESITYGTSKVDKVIKEGKFIYTLVKGEIVSIKDFKDNIYTVVDDKGNEFKVNGNYIEIRKIRERVTRGNVSTRARSINKVVGAAYDALGKPYVGGDTGKRGYDCSGLTYSIYLNNLGIKLPRSSNVQVNAGTTVEKADLIPGDLIFFRTSGKGIGHVGLYIGDNNMIHASSGQGQIIITDINAAYYKTRYVTSKRIIN